MIIIKKGIIHTMEDQEEMIGDIAIENGKIQKIAIEIIDHDAEIIDAAGKHIYPGFIDAHSHLGMDETAIRYEGNDVNERSNPITPEMRGIDGINPMDESIENACAGGVTTVCSGPGSANVLGGTFAIFKTHGNCIDDMIVKNPVAMKCAFGENPKFCYQGSQINTRMKVASLLRETLYKAKEYYDKKEKAKNGKDKMPAFDLQMEALIPVINKEMPLKAHAHRADDILTAIRIAKELDVELTLDHCTEGHLIADKVLESGFSAIVGPSLSHKTKYELKNLTFETAGILQRKGVKVAIITDAPIVPQNYLPLSAGLAVKAGMNHFEALKAITINPAEILKIDHIVGSIKEGKDADIVISDGDILESSTKVLYTMIDGEIVYQA